MAGFHKPVVPRPFFRKTFISSLYISMLGSGTVLGGVYGMFAALAAAQPLGYFLSAAFVKHRFGLENYPLFPSDLEREKTPCSNSPFPGGCHPGSG